MAAKRSGDDSGTGFWPRFVVLTVVVLWVSFTGGNWVGRYLLRNHPKFAVTSQESYRNVSDQRSRLRGRPPVVSSTAAPAEDAADPQEPLESGAPEPAASSEVAVPAGLSSAAPSPSSGAVKPTATSPVPRTAASPVKPTAARPTPTAPTPESKPTMDVPPPPKRPDHVGSEADAPAPPVPTPERPAAPETPAAAAPEAPVPTPAGSNGDG